uniref:Flavin-containing monooxygenase n=1 Tax=Ornithodoros turicata TaxID=34597 RepID=A0A2R5LMU9_9ACAR
MRVVIVGAGTAGVAALKACVEEGIDAVCYERDEDIGGLWWFRDDKTPPGRSTVMRHTVANSSKELSAFSDFPQPAEFPPYPHNTQMLQYLRLYVDHFNLRGRISFGKQVNAVQCNDDSVTLKVQEGDQVTQETFDYCLLCLGHHTVPNMPDAVPGQERFEGKLIHAQDFRDGTPFKGQRVCVVGLGNSGGDVAVELSWESAVVFLSARRGNWVLPPLIGDSPADAYFMRRISALKTGLLVRLLGLRGASWFTERKLDAIWDHDLLGLKPDHPYLSQAATINGYLYARIMSGAVRVRKGIKAFTERGVIFDGTDIEEPLDAVVYATGYRADKLPIENTDDILPRDQMGRPVLYKGIFCPEKPRLGYIGHIDASGSLMEMFEMQSRYAARVFAGHVTLPTPAEMRAVAEEDVQRRTKDFIDSPRHHIMVTKMEYVDHLAEEIGCRPPLQRLFFTDPRMFKAVMFGPFLNSQYRLVGPHPWSGARQVLLGYQERVRNVLKPPRPVRAKSRAGLAVAAACTAAAAAFTLKSTSGKKPNGDVGSS